MKTSSRPLSSLFSRCLHVLPKANNRSARILGDIHTILPPHLRIPILLRFLLALLRLPQLVPLPMLDLRVERPEAILRLTSLCLNNLGKVSECEARERSKVLKEGRALAGYVGPCHFEHCAEGRADRIEVSRNLVCAHGVGG